MNILDIWHRNIKKEEAIDFLWSIRHGNEKRRERFWFPKGISKEWILYLHQAWMRSEYHKHNLYGKDIVLLWHLIDRKEHWQMFTYSRFGAAPKPKQEYPGIKEI